MHKLFSRFSRITWNINNVRKIFLLQKKIITKLSFIDAGFLLKEI